MTTLFCLTFRLPVLGGDAYSWAASAAVAHETVPGLAKQGFTWLSHKSASAPEPDQEAVADVVAVVKSELSS